MTPALLVDDDRPLLASVAASAKTAGLNLVVAGSWDEGLALFHVLSPELVIADYNMPGSRMGLQLLAEIRRLRPSVRLVLVSGYLDAENIAEVAALDLVDATLAKGSAIETAQAIVGEIRTMSESGSSPTDWRRFARAYVHAAGVSTESVDRLDEIFSIKLDRVTELASEPVATEISSESPLGYFDTSALMRWVERDVGQPQERNVRVGAAVDELLEEESPLAVSDLTLVEFRAAVAEDWRRSEPEVSECDAAWAQRAKVALMERIADGRIAIVPAPPHAYEHAMTLVDMAARDHGLALGTWDAIHLITACAWGHTEGARIRLYTTNGHFEKFTRVYPHFERFAEIVHLDLSTRT
jgi:ActR/RegA family two-component response regulator